MIIILVGCIGRLPVGGNAWCEMQYLLGLQSLGHEVFYLEDCGEGSWVYNWETQEVTTELAYPGGYVRECLEPFGLGERWIYRAGEECVGAPLDAFLDVCSRADLLIVRGGAMPVWRPEYDRPRRRIFIDSDPGFTQIELLSGNRALANAVDHCERLFTIAQRMGAEDCSIPDADRRWLKTVFPISLAHWPPAEREARYFTSVMQWRSYREVVHDGVRYGNKDKEFPKFVELPRLTAQPFQIALMGAPPGTLTEYGWKTLEGWLPSRTPQSYQDFIQGSRAEFSVVKHGYIETHGGWFGDRSICYLASGRPVLMQDTGLREWLPTGEGLITFRDVAEALAGVDAINADYERHRRAARKLAEEYFAAGRVLPPLLESAMA